jgi:flagellar biosynthesis anti-sigma factor FlgM
MDPFDNPHIFKRPTEDPAEEGTGKQPSEGDANLPPIDDARRKKIESLKKAVADGTYTVSAEEVARKLIEHMLEPKE